MILSVLKMDIIRIPPYICKADPLSHQIEAVHGYILQLPRLWKDRLHPRALADLNIYEVRRNRWNLHDFNEFSAMRVVPVEDGKYDYYVNMDNHWLHDDIKQRGPSSEPEEMKFKYGLALVALAILWKDLRTGVSNDSEELAIEVTELVEKVTRAYAPVLLLAVQDF